MGQVDLAEAALVGLHVHMKPAVFNGVQRVVLQAGHDVVPLYSLGKVGGRFAQKEGILPLGFLSAPQAA